MLTQIEIDGFKTFKDFKVELAPFQVIVGPNGSGKSNLFDALHLLSRLADTDLLSAFQEMRGEAGELFTKLPEGKSVDRMRIAVEMLVDRKIQDSWGKQPELRYTRLRYELGIMQRTDEYGLERLYITNESLKSIPENEDNWCRKYGLFSQKTWLPTATDDLASLNFISTDEQTQTNTATIYLHIEEHPYELSGKIPFEAQAAQRTVLSGVTSSIGFPHSFATREELHSLKFLHLNPEVLREPSSTNAPRFLSTDGSNLPATLVRMQAEDNFALTGVSLDMANLVPGILRIKVERDKASDKYVICAETSDGRSFSSQVLSDGTLRLLALAAFRNDPQFHGVLCIEEPENGVDPLHIERMARLLREMATDFNDPLQQDEPLRQVLITTHSSVFISQPDVINSLLVAFTPTHIEGKNIPSMQVTRMAPIIMPNTPSAFDKGVDRAIEAYSINQVRKYLEMEAFDEARDQLEKARTLLSEG